ncbi:MAG: DUF805 domain-containing protein [Porticoccaceae bacterium]|nr:DUF805 domain-containing protein [Porticoccaceae bacterium]
MNFLDATKNYFVKWLDFRTRISRSEFWWGYLGSVIVSILVGICIGFVFGFISVMMGWPVETTVNLAILPFQIYVAIAAFSLAVRRLHDVNKSGWWLLITLTIVGILLLFYWYCKKGDDIENRFGPNPLKSEEFELNATEESI